MRSIYAGTMVVRSRPVKVTSGFARKGRIRPCEMAEQDFTEDAILGDRVRVRQPSRGYRVNADTILLAAAVEAKPGMRLMEAGCGVGAALLCVAARAPGAHFVGVERDANIAACARENIALNAILSRAEIHVGDVLERSAKLGVFDGVFVNPPFDLAHEGRAPAPSRIGSHVSDANLEVWIARLADRLRGGGALTLIQRAHKLPEILRALEGRLGGAEAFPIRPRADAEAKRVIVRARKGSRAPFRLWAGLDLHDSSGAKHTAMAEAILRGEAAIFCDQ